MTLIVDIWDFGDRHNQLKTSRFSRKGTGDRGKVTTDLYREQRLTKSGGYLPSSRERRLAARTACMTDA